MTKLLYPVVFFDKNGIISSRIYDTDHDYRIESSNFNEVVRLTEIKLKEKVDEYIRYHRVVKMPYDIIYVRMHHPQRVEYLTVEVSNEIYNSSVAYYKGYFKNLEKFLCDGPSRLEYITSYKRLINNNFTNNDNSLIKNKNINNYNKILDDEFLIEYTD